MSKQKRLGRGLESLLGSAPRRIAAVDDPVASSSSLTVEMNVAALAPGRYQPRQVMEEDSLSELADSIRQQGVLQPLVVRPVPPSADNPSLTHEIVAGERRWRAAQLAGQTSVPVVVRELDDQSALAIALIENLQREDLNPIEQASSLYRLAQEFDLTHEQVGAAVGRSRSSVSNLLRLLDLQEEVRDLLASGGIDMGHARALLPLTGKRQAVVARRIAADGLSVRQVEQVVRSMLEKRDTAEKSSRPAIDLQTRWLQQQFAKELGQRVTIRTQKDGNRKLDIDFADLEQLQTALQKIEALIDQVRTTAGPRVREVNE